MGMGEGDGGQQANPRHGRRREEEFGKRCRALGGSQRRAAVGKRSVAVRAPYHGAGEGYPKRAKGVGW
jgi:hypothetical protein